MFFYCKSLNYNTTKTNCEILIHTHNKGAPIFQIKSAAVLEGDIPYYYGRSDCDNGYPFSNVDYSFSNPNDVTFRFPDGLQGWKHISQWFKSRFTWNNNKFTNRDVISLISGGHSVGIAHERISGFSGPWDFTPNTLDNELISVLFGETYILNLPFLQITQNWIQEIRNPNVQGSKSQWQIPQPESIIEQFNLDDPSIFDPPLLSLNLALNSDISMVYDISYYIENGIQESIDCVTNAKLVCPINETILTAPRSNNIKFTNFNTNVTNPYDELGEQLECGVNEVCCEYVQCPIQCEGGYDRFNRIINNATLFSNLENDNKQDFDCPAALAYKYNMQSKQDTLFENRLLGQHFAKAFLKMITIGYVDENDNSNVLLQIVGDED